MRGLTDAELFVIDNATNGDCSVAKGMWRESGGQEVEDAAYALFERGLVALFVPCRNCDHGSHTHVTKLGYYVKELDRMAKGK